MAKEAAEHIENSEKTLNKPSIVRRFCAGLIDFLIGAILVLGLFLLTYFFIFPKLNYFSKIDEVNEKYIESNLYIVSNEKIYSVDEKIGENDNLKEAYDDRIIYFYTHDERALSLNKIETYSEAKIASNLFYKDDSQNIVEKNDIEYKVFKDFYEKQYSLALEFLNSDPLIVKNGNETYLTMVLSVIIILTFVSFIIYFLIPLFTKNNATLAQLMLKIGLARKITNSKPKWYHILIRYLILYLISFLAPFLIYLKFTYFSIVIVGLNLLLMCVTKEKIGFHDIVSKTYLVDLRSEHIIQFEKGKRPTDESDRVSKLLGK